MPGLFKKKIEAFEQVSFVTRVFWIFLTLRENHLANSEVFFNREIRFREPCLQKRLNMLFVETIYYFGKSFDRVVKLVLFFLLEIF